MTAEVANIKKGPKWLLLIQGIALIILGILLFTTPAKTTVLLVVLLGIYWLVSGIVNIVWLFFDRTAWGWKLVLGILGIIAGLLIIQHPLWSTILVPTTLIIVMGVWGIMMGIVALIQAFTGGGWGAGILGILSIIFGIILLANPIFAAIGLPFILGMFAVVAGIAALVGFFIK
jgi:uncharacterized membrane protein HdeD (DUF308 family)